MCKRVFFFCMCKSVCVCVCVCVHVCAYMTNYVRFGLCHLTALMTVLKVAAAASIH